MLLPQDRLRPAIGDQLVGGQALEELDGPAICEWAAALE